MSRYLKIFEEFKEEYKQLDFLRKEPKFYPFFVKIMTNDIFFSIKNAKELYKKIQSHKNTIKENNLEEELLNCDTPEQVEDLLDNVKIIEKFNKFTKLLPNNLRTKVRNNDELKKKFKEMIVSMEYDEYKLFLKKVARYKTTDELFTAIDHYLEENKSMIDLENKIISEKGSDIFYKKGNILIAIVYDSDTSCNLGSSQWCISRSDYYWNQYNTYKAGVQYFIWDFGKKESDNLHKIGATIYPGDYVAHDKFDNPINIVDFEWSRLLKDIFHLDDIKFLKLISLNPDILNNKIAKDRLEKVDDSSKKEMIMEEPILVKHFKDLSFLSDDDLIKLLDKDDKLAFIDQFYKRLDSKYIMKSVFKYPDYINKLPNGFIENIGRDDYLKLLNTLLYRYNFGNKVKDWNSTETQNVYSVINNFRNLVKKDWLSYKNTIKKLFKNYTENALIYFSDLLIGNFNIEEILEMYEDNEEEWKEVFNKNWGDIIVQNRVDLKTFTKVRNVLKNPDAFKKFINSDLYAFNARYVNKKVGENPRNGKSIYEEVLDIEMMVRITPFDNNSIGGMKMRARMQGDLKTYAIWVTKDMFDEDVFSPKEDYLIDLIEKHMFPI